MGAEAAIRLEGVSYAYAAGPPALERIDLAVAPGARLGIFGPNGGGKSTLLRLILGLIEPAAGHVTVFGGPPRAAVRAGLVGYLPQRATAELRAPLSVRQVVAMAAGRGVPPWRGLDAAARARVAAMLELTGIADLAERPIGALSGGQQQRAFIARALAGGPRLLLLDEPTVGIDRAGRDRFARLLDDAHARLGLTILVVSHNLQAIARGCDTIAVLAGTLHYHAAPSGLTADVVAEVFHHDIAHTHDEREEAEE